jgi:hypothetical protein
VTLTGSSNPACYQRDVDPRDPSYPALIVPFSAAGQAVINQADDTDYGGGDVITIEISKICSTPPEAPTFATTSGHL